MWILPFYKQHQQRPAAYTSLQTMTLPCRCRICKRSKISLASVFYFLVVCEILSLIGVISMSARQTVVIEQIDPIEQSDQINNGDEDSKLDLILPSIQNVMLQQIIPNVVAPAKNVRVTATNSKNKHYKGLSYVKNFSYPLHINLTAFVESLLLRNETTKIAAINPHPYQYTLLPTNKCNFTKMNEYSLIILVKSDILNFDRRQAIRETWGNLSHSLDIPMVFLLGVQNTTVSTEEKQFEDIVQEDFIDVYRNNTLKTIMGFNWAIDYCSSAKYLFFVDDDYFVNVNNVAKLPKRFLNRKHVFTGSFSRRSVPYRNSGSKWDISWDEYPFDYWPPYIMGGSYLMSMNTAVRFKAAFPYVKPLHIDDAYLGIVSRKLNIIPFPGGGFHSGKKRKPASSMSNTIASHGYSNVSHVYETWKKWPKKPNISGKV